MNDFSRMHNDYLDPDRHLWDGDPEDCCANCGVKFPADLEITEGMPQWDGYCCAECQEGKPCIDGAAPPLAAFLTRALGRNCLAGWSKALFKGTACGAWLAISGPHTVRVGSIVEGVDACAEEQELSWPFTEEQFWSAVQAVEDDVEHIWNETHGCDTCADHWEAEFGDREPGEHGMTPIWKDCPDCEGHGIII